MNWLSFYTKTYSALRSSSGVPYWVLTPLRKLTRLGANKMLPCILAKHRERKGVVERGVIVSFTSFPARIGDVWQVVKSLKNQSVLPEKIILWLSLEQFPDKLGIPESLLKEVDDLFEIRMVEGDIRSHKKFYYVMNEYPDKSFITCDDDIYYHPDTLRYLVEGSKKFPNCVIANTARYVQHNEAGELLPYNSWKVVRKSYETTDLIQTGVGGVLYPPHVLHDMTLMKEIFTTLTPMADDLWLNSMARLKGTPIVKSGLELLPLPIKNGSDSLSSINVGLSKNDEQLQAMRSWLSDSLFDPYISGYHVSFKGCDTSEIGGNS